MRASRLCPISRPVLTRACLCMYMQAEHVVRAMQALCAAGVKSHAVYDNLIASLKDIQRLQAARKHQEAANAKDASGSSMAEVIHKEAAKRGASGMRVLGLSILSLWQLQSVYNVLKALDHAGAEDFGQVRSQ